uniref:Uncharacterized protein n=1 Tax=Lactuca sativa TaxID=4236 RepID=A0A9R1WH45_LACSA|nr:hypothetical protein LSAT_V11C100038890 [Lactuca sativa]
MTSLTFSASVISVFSPCLAHSYLIRGSLRYGNEDRERNFDWELSQHRTGLRSRSHSECFRTRLGTKRFSTQFLGLPSELGKYGLA